MLAQSNAPAVHAGENQSSPATSAPGQYWYTTHPEYEAKSVADLVANNHRGGFEMRVGDAVYVAEIRRHVLTDADLNAAARAVIGGAA
jgi:hypothetical protein